MSFIRLVGLLMIVILVILTVFAFIDPFKENLDNNRGGSTLNCPGTSSFDQTAYDSQTNLAKLTYRPTCFVTGLSMVFFVFSVISAAFIWLFRNWSRT